MAKPKTPKDEAILCHKVATLMSLLADYTDDLYPDSPISKKYKERSDEMMPVANELLESLFQIPKIGQTTYLNDLANKIDSVLRHNYERIIP